MKIVKRGLALALAATLMLGTMIQAHAASSTFTDVKVADWYYTYVEQVAEKGWISGYGDGTFGPDNPVTYAEFNTMLMRAFLPYTLEWLNIDSKEPWYLPYCVSAAPCSLLTCCEVDRDITPLYVDPYTVSLPATRSDMAIMIDHLLDWNLTAVMPSEAEREAAARGTPDMDAGNGLVEGTAPYYIAEVKATGISQGSNA